MAAAPFLVRISKPCSGGKPAPAATARLVVLRRYQERYEKDAYIKGPYRDMIRDRIAAIRDRYGLASAPPHKEWVPEPELQGSLFATMPACDG